MKFFPAVFIFANAILLSSQARASGSIECMTDNGWIISAILEEDAETSDLHAVDPKTNKKIPLDIDYLGFLPEGFKLDAFAGGSKKSPFF